MLSKYHLLLLLTSFLWSGSFIVGKVLVNHASPITLTILRWGLSLLFLLPPLLYGQKKMVPPRGALWPLFGMGVTGVLLFNVLQFWALAKTTAMNVGLISTLNPLSIALFASLFRYDKLRPSQIAAMLLSLAGVILVISKGNLQQLCHLQFNEGDLWMVAAVSVWGLYSIFTKAAMQYVTPLAATFYSGLFGFLLLLPLAGPDFAIDQADGAFWGAMLYMSFLSTVLCMFFWNLGVQKVGATTAGVFLNFNPIFTAIIAFLLLGEPLTLLQSAGTVIVVSGCYLFSRFSGKK
ncbi:MAG: DMT family transporter [Sporomusaceae bacterium]|nr:DMT family transporter [Sporomusaceae bacterium]